MNLSLYTLMMSHEFITLKPSELFICENTDENSIYYFALFDEKQFPILESDTTTNNNPSFYCDGSSLTNLNYGSENYTKKTDVRYLESFYDGTFFDRNKGKGEIFLFNLKGKDVRITMKSFLLVNDKNDMPSITIVKPKFTVTHSILNKNSLTWTLKPKTILSFMDDDGTKCFIVMFKNNLFTIDDSHNIQNPAFYYYGKSLGDLKYGSYFQCSMNGSGNFVLFRDQTWLLSEYRMREDEFHTICFKDLETSKPLQKENIDALLKIPKTSFPEYIEEIIEAKREFEANDYDSINSRIIASSGGVITRSTDFDE
jgi:hypothetical protein